MIHSQLFARRKDQAKYPQLWDGLVGAWSPGLGPTGLTLYDFSGKCNHGTRSGSTTLADTWVVNQGRVSQFFNGSTDKVVTKILPEIASFGTVTASCWFRPLSTANGLLISDTSGTNRSLNLEWSRTANKVSWRCGPGTIYYSTASLSVDVWHHAALVRSVTAGVTDGHLYLNGVLDSSSLGVSGGNGSGALTFGENGTFNNLYFNGYIDSVAIHNREARQGEIRLLASRRGIIHERASRRFYSIPAGVVAATFRRSLSARSGSRGSM